MKKFLFINADRSLPQCAIFQAGKVYADALRLCTEFELEYHEVGSEDIDGEIINLPSPYDHDAVIFNYQHVSSKIIPPVYINSCPVAIGFLYEARQDPASSPLHFDDLLVGQVFDVIISPDPTLESSPRVWGTDRVIPRNVTSYTINNPYPVISTFGFPSPWKDLDTVVRMMCDEFKKATFRINYAPASHQQGMAVGGVSFEVMAFEMIDSLRHLIRPGIDISYTSKYMTDSELISWLSESSLNVFMAKEERGIQTGGALLASVDVAIAAMKPILVSNNIEARHLAGLYGDTLEYSMIHSPSSVRHYYQTWTAENFAAKIDNLVRGYLC